MIIDQLEHPSSLPDLFHSLSFYEKGALARAFIKSLVRQGCLESCPQDDAEGTIRISIEQWQLKLLARFSADCEDAKERSNETLLDLLCQLR